MTRTTTGLMRTATAIVLAFGLAATARAIPVTINMTADNILNSGGLCFDASCTNGTTWNAWGPMPNAANWQQSDSVTLDLGPGTHYFAWFVLNDGQASSTNPAGLLAEILWDGNANRSSSAWEVYDVVTGAFIEAAVEYGTNGGPNIWTSANGGPVSGISTLANWIYTSNNFASADASAWFRSSITIAVPEPGSIGLLLAGLLGIGAFRLRGRSA